ANRGARDATHPNGYDPMAERFSLGKGQPYAGRSVGVSPANGAPPYNTYTFPDSMVLAQAATAVTGQPINTFGQHNAKGAQPGTTFTWDGTKATLSDTLMAPFDWFVHMDRPLVNKLELLQVRDSAPHR